MPVGDFLGATNSGFSVMGKNILFSICSQGLGHATRSLPLIKHYLRGNEIFVCSHGAALHFLQEELQGSGVTFCDLQEEYPDLERGKGLSFYYYLAHDIARMKSFIKREQATVQDIVRREGIDLIFSDGKYGSYSPRVPSFLLCHQVSLVMPKGLRLFQRGTDNYNLEHFKKFDALLICDYANPERNLSGRLSHNRLVNKLNHHYIGILSCYRRRKVEKDIDYYFIMSGYLRDHRESFLRKLQRESRKLEGKKVFILGDTSRREHIVDPEHSTEVYSFVSSELRESLMNRAKLVVSRSGYSTVMDLVELGLPAVVVPTPSQGEQEYLAEYLCGKGHFASAGQYEFRLPDLVRKARCATPFRARHKTRETLALVDKIVSDYMSERFPETA